MKILTMTDINDMMTMQGVPNEHILLREQISCAQGVGSSEPKSDAAQFLNRFLGVFG